MWPHAAFVAARNMAAEGRRAAALDRVHHLQLGVAHVAAVGATPSGTVIAEDVRDLQSWTGHCCSALLRLVLASSVRGASRSSGLTMSRSTLLATCA